MLEILSELPKNLLSLPAALKILIALLACLLFVGLFRKRHTLKRMYHDWLARKNGITIIDNFFKDPDAVRAMALAGRFKTYPEPGSGLISEKPFDQGIWEASRLSLGEIERVFNECDLEKANELSGHFHMTPEGSNPGGSFIHKDTDQWNMIVYLNPDDLEKTAEYRVGTTIWRRKPRYSHLPWSKASSFDPKEWDWVCEIPMKYNRLVLFDGNKWHSRGDFSDLGLWGIGKEDSRLVQVLWFRDKKYTELEKGGNEE